MKGSLDLYLFMAWLDESQEFEEYCRKLDKGDERRSTAACSEEAVASEANIRDSPFRWE